MRIPSIILPLLACALTAGAQTKPADVPAKEAALERLLGERSSTEALDTAILDARKQGVSEQAILEARFVFHVDRNEDAAVASLLPEFLKRETTFKLEDSEIFATREEWLAVIEYVKALSSLQAGDKAGFKSHITEAFWLSPKQGNAFAPHIDRLRLEETLASLQVDFTESYIPLSGGKASPLSNYLGDGKALLLQFWSPLSAECEALLPDFSKIAAEIQPKGISVATLIMDNSPAALADAQTMIGATPAGTWLIDHERNPLSTRMRIQNVPVFVLISREGKVISFGAADHSGLWKELALLNPSITRPKLDSSPQ